jgi:toxin ParE1/3/4
MATFFLSPRAAEDMAGIATYTLSTWGESQMLKYVGALRQCARLLAENSKLGRPCGWIRPGLRRFEKSEHVIYYRLQPDGILISRVLHRSMNPLRHNFDDETED